MKLKKSVIITCAMVLIAWSAVFCAALIKTLKADIIGGADWPTFKFMLTKCLRSPFGIAVQIITVAAAVFLVVLAIISLCKKSKRQ